MHHRLTLRKYHQCVDRGSTNNIINTNSTMDTEREHHNRQDVLVVVILEELLSLTRRRQCHTPNAVE